MILFEYQLHGCFLILGGFIFNTLPFVMLLRPPIPGFASTSESRGSEQSDLEAVEESLIKQNGKKLSANEALDTDSLPKVFLRCENKIPFKKAQLPDEYFK